MKITILSHFIFRYAIRARLEAMIPQRLQSLYLDMRYTFPS